MTARPLDPSTRDTVLDASHATPRAAHHENICTPATRQNNASPGDSPFTPWTPLSAASSRTSASGSVMRHDAAPSKRLRPSAHVLDRIAYIHGTVPDVSPARLVDNVPRNPSPLAPCSRVGYGQQPSPCTHMPGFIRNHPRDAPTGLFKPAEMSTALLTTRTSHLFPLPGNIGDRRPSPGQGNATGSSTATLKRLKTPGPSDPTSPGFGINFVPQLFSPDDAKVGPPANASVYYQPMSTLTATGSPYRHGAGLSARGGPSLIRPTVSTLHVSNTSVQQDGSDNTEAGPVARIQRHFSPYYQGDIFLPANQSEDIADDLNCSLFIVNLPPSLTTHELLAAIHRLGPTGRIFAIHINGPELQRNHPGCAAKVVFFKREVAHKFFRHCEVNGFRVNGNNARVMWNRIKTSEKPHLAKSDASRVLLIGGPPSLVNSSTLTDFFHTKLQFQIDSIITHVQGSLGAEDAVIEYRFGSFRCQAQAAKMALGRELPHIRCFFGKDPLEPEAYRPYEYHNFTDNV